ncbi:MULTISPECIES: TRADD-N-associated membrane domain-containing protein [Rhodococcus erythropolis group]|uniref:Cyanobacterial TRADD-N associated 2 transmembrane domain-containing protein n=1 Tax=Rhodococcus erythropolis TaxID=1833 RepID=A0A8I1D7H0_RHOER|nr:MULTISPECIES: hypothetical protein [Rhodococcus erythropolis group]MBH5144212.1 hypothetical protein [Rhodococcus erythropolis]MDJ0434668.1 hypothetical protein [Rhodococcus qingshengii]QEM25745.1 hypothetical protein D6M20_02595 [Rhodococcus qingshengii]
MSENSAVSAASIMADTGIIQFQPLSSTILVVALVLFLTMAMSMLFQLRKARYEATVTEIRNATANTIDQPEIPSIDPIQLQRREDLALLKEYHARSLTQSQLSFRFALGAAVFGFVFILFSVGTVAVGGYDQVGVAGMQLGAGVVVESVAGLFFVLSNQSRTMLGAFFDKLREDRKLDESLRLARELPESSPVRDRLQAALAIQLAGADETVLSAVLHLASSAPEPDRAVRTITEEAS